MPCVYLRVCFILVVAVLQGCEGFGGSDDRSKPVQEPITAPQQSVEKTPPPKPAPPPPPEPAPQASTPAPQQRQAWDAVIDLKNAQTLLNKGGYKAGPPDGKMGPRTRQALRRFQKEQGLPVTGNLDQETMNRLTSR